MVVNSKTATQKEKAATSLPLQQTEAELATSVLTQKQCLRDLYSNPKLTGVIKNFPIAQFLNVTETRPGLFLKNSEIAKSGWNATGLGTAYTHTYRDVGKTKCEGLWFSTVKMHIIDASVRAIEITSKGAEAIGLGNSALNWLPRNIKAGTIIGIYADKNGKTINPAMIDVYEALKAEGFATLRTFYLIQILSNEIELDDNNQPIVNSFGQQQLKPAHSVPFCLSVHGAAASFLGKAIDGLAINYAAYIGLESMEVPSLEGISLLVFEPTFAATMVGIEQQSFVTDVESFTEVNDETLSWIVQPHRQEIYDNIREKNADFAHRYALQCANDFGVHNVIAGVDLSLPQASLPKSINETQYPGGESWDESWDLD